MCLHRSKVAEWIEVMFGVETPRGPGNILLDLSPDTLLCGGGGVWNVLDILYINFAVPANLHLPDAAISIYAYIVFLQFPHRDVVKSTLPIDCIVYTTVAPSVYLGREPVIAYGLIQVGGLLQAFFCTQEALSLHT